MRRLFLMVLLVLLAIPAGLHLLRRTEPGDGLNTRPSAIQRSLADLCLRFDLLTDWANNVEHQECLWQVNEILRQVKPEWRSQTRGSMRIEGFQYEGKLKAIRIGK